MTPGPQVGKDGVKVVAKSRRTIPSVEEVGDHSPSGNEPTLGWLPELQTNHEGKEGVSTPGLHGAPSWGLGECPFGGQLWREREREAVSGTVSEKEKDAAREERSNPSVQTTGNNTAHDLTRGKCRQDRPVSTHTAYVHIRTHATACNTVRLNPPALLSHRP